MAYNPAAYEGQRRNVDYDYSRDAATNAYGRFLSQQRGNRSLGEYDLNFQRSYPRFGASWGARGLQGQGVDSGVQRQAMRNYLGDFYRGRGYMQQDQAQEQQQYDMQQQLSDQWRQNALADIALQESNEVASLAANIAALRQMMGGL